MAGEGGRSRRGAKKSGPPAARNAAVKVRSARRRKPSSTEWLSRQLNDPYVVEAQRLGYRSRAAFKLIELDDRFRLLLPGRRVVDLGCAPGGWTQVAVERVKPTIGKGEAGQGAVIGIDIPIGLPDTGRRQADVLAYTLVGPRRSSVFMTPVRAALEAAATTLGSSMAIGTR